MYVYYVYVCTCIMSPCVWVLCFHVYVYHIFVCMCIMSPCACIITPCVCIITQEDVHMHKQADKTKAQTQIDIHEET